MAICYKCGSVMQIEDAAKHVCNPANVPAKGKELQPQNIAVSVVEL